MDRVFGLETEYGLLGRSATGRLSSSEAAQWLFRPLEAEYRSSNVFLANGGRCYLDVGAHPEYATPECRTPLAAVVAGRAGDEMMVTLAARATDAAAEAGTTVSLRLFKNNTDSYGNTYGSHENYLVARSTDPAMLADGLTSFLVTRQLICGAGRLLRGAFLVSQRADHLHDAFSAMTTRARPLVNSRDEPLADPARFRRLHVLAGDSNLSETSGWLKLATTELVLRRLEAGDGFSDLLLADPIGALPRVARNPKVLLERAGGGTISALALQRGFAERVVPGPGEEAVVSEWLRVLDALDADDPDAIADTVEWAAKRQLLAQTRARHALVPDDPRLAALDLAFHELGGLFGSLESRGIVRRLSDPVEVARAVEGPPSDTRAALRSRLVTAARVAGVSFAIDWTGLTVHNLPGADGVPSERAVSLPDPLATSSQAVDDLVAALGFSRD